MNYRIIVLNEIDCIATYFKALRIYSRCYSIYFFCKLNYLVNSNSADGKHGQIISYKLLARGFVWNQAWVMQIEVYFVPFTINVFVYRMSVSFSWSRIQYSHTQSTKEQTLIMVKNYIYLSFHRRIYVTFQYVSLKVFFLIQNMYTCFSKLINDK